MFRAIKFERWGLASSRQTLSAWFGSSCCRVHEMSNSWKLFQVATFELYWFLFCNIHIALEIFSLYNSTAHSTLFPFISSCVLSPSGYILCLLSMIMGSNIVGLTYLHFHLYPHMTNPIHHCSFPYLGNFMVVLTKLVLSKFVASCFVIYILNSKLLLYTIPPRIPRTHKLHSTIVQKCFKVSIVAFHPH